MNTGVMITIMMKVMVMMLINICTIIRLTTALMPLVYTVPARSTSQIIYRNNLLIPGTQKAQTIIPSTLSGLSLHVIQTATKGFEPGRRNFFSTLVPGSSGQRPFSTN